MAARPPNSDFSIQRRIFHTMTKRIIALFLCAVMLVSCLVGCAKKEDEENPDVGSYVTMYLTDDIYDFDPANAYYNTDTLNVVSLMFDTLFRLNEDGKVEKSLVKEYKFANDKRTGEPYLELVLKETKWSNGTRLSADDVAFAWRRLLTSANNYSAASLLFDIKNARAVKEGDISIDNVGIEAVGIDRVKITFEGPVDEDQFLLNLTSVATAPLLESYVTKNDDWAKKPSTMVTSGPFKLGKVFFLDVYNDKGAIKEEEDPYAFNKSGDLEPTASYPLKKINYFYLERNIYYFRDTEKDAIGKSVTPHRLLVDCTKSDADLYADYVAGKLFYLGSIPLSLRGDAYMQSQATVSQSLSTFVLYMNQYAVIDNGSTGEMLFANAAVRKALSLAIDRNAIAQAVVYAQAATGLVAPGVFNNGRITKKNVDFRSAATDLLATGANIDEAKNVLTQAGINAADYAFSIKVGAYDDVNVKIVDMVAESWKALGFDVSVEKLTPIQNNDYLKEINAVPTDVCDDRVIEALQRQNYEVVALDYTAYTADAYSVLSNFATPFSGMSLNMDTNQINLHQTGYSSVEYNVMMEAIYYIPYYASLEGTSSEYLAKIKDKKPYIDTALGFALGATSQFANVLSSVRALTQVDKLDEIEDEDLDNLIDRINVVLDPMQIANRDLVRAYETAGATFDGQEELDVVMADTLVTRDTAIVDLRAAVMAARAAKKAGILDTAKQQAAETAKAKMEASFQAWIDSIVAAQTVFETAADAAEVAAQGASAKTLYELVGEIYAANGITPTTDTSKWGEQKAVLLHKAEEILMKDLPVIPVIFTQNAVVTSDQLTHVNYKYTPYYYPSYFTKMSLKDYESYMYFDEKTQLPVSIFEEFPTISWDRVGK